MLLILANHIKLPVWCTYRPAALKFIILTFAIKNAATAVRKQNDVFSRVQVSIHQEVIIWFPTETD